MLKPANFRGAWVPRSGMRMQPLLLFTGVVVVALLFGFMIAAYPPSFSAKAAALLIGPVALLFGLFSARFGQTTSDGHIGRALMGVWAFLLGSCPVYVPFKFGALPGLNPLRLVYAAIIVGWLASLITSAQLRAALRARIAQSRTVFTLISALLVWQFFCAVVGSEPFFSLYLVVKVMLPLPSAPTSMFPMSPRWWCSADHSPC